MCVEEDLGALSWALLLVHVQGNERIQSPQQFARGCLCSGAFSYSIFFLHLTLTLPIISSNPPGLSAASALGKSQACLSTFLLCLGSSRVDNHPGLSLPSCFRALRGLGPAPMRHRVLIRGFLQVLRLPQRFPRG